MEARTQIIIDLTRTETGSLKHELNIYGSAFTYIEILGAIQHAASLFFLKHGVEGLNLDAFQEYMKDKNVFSRSKLEPEVKKKSKFEKKKENLIKKLTKKPIPPKPRTKKIA